MADAVFYIQKGKVKITVVSEQARKPWWHFWAPGNSARRRQLAGQPKRIGTATAVSSAIIPPHPNSTILRLIHEEPAFAESFVAHLLERSVRVEADLIDPCSIRAKGVWLARCFYMLANFGKEHDPEPIIAKISQETLAQMIGTTRAPRVSSSEQFRRLASFPTMAIAGAPAFCSMSCCWTRRRTRIDLRRGVSNTAQRARQARSRDKRGIDATAATED